MYVALAGNPNCGKTTLFNALTGLRHRVGNYAGVTVERREGRLTGTDTTLLDLPGTYSLTARSPDEEIARDVLLGRFPPVPDMVVVVVDASNLERNLYLYSQVADLGLPVLLALNMTDVAERAGAPIDAAALEKELGAPVLPLVASRGIGLGDLRRRLEGAPPPPVRRWTLPEPMERETALLAGLLEQHGLCRKASAFFLALTLLSLPDSHLPGEIEASGAILLAREEALARLRAQGIDPETAAVESRYAWIEDVCAGCVRHTEPTPTWSDRIDRFATHRVGGFALFFALMWLMFNLVFTWAETPMGWIEAGQQWLSGLVAGALPEGDLRGLIVDGVIAGVGGVVIFLPQIFLLFLFLGLLEDSGYMARAAFVMDRLMSRVGLHGKSFIPLLSSFACAIPGIMATRTIEDRRDRLVTILVAPLMSCSARLPVYSLLVAGFIPQVALWGPIRLQPTVMVSLYLLGVAAALGMAALFKRFLFRGEAPLFLIELPPYRLPGLKTVILQTWERGSHFVRRAGTIILAVSILLWVLMNYPGRPDASPPERLAESAAGSLGHLIEPAIAPFGMDWKIGIGILGSFAAREVFVSTMAIVYNVEDEDEARQEVSLRRQMAAEVKVDGTPRFTARSAAALLVFYVLAMQCVSTMAVVRRETGSWKWPLFQWAYMLVLAWTGSVLVYQLGGLLGLS